MRSSLHLFTIAASLLFYASGQAAVANEPRERPNVLLFFVDDMGAADLGCYGSDLYRTPNIDRLAAQGQRFTRAYAAAPVCSPTRAGLMTGKAPARLRLTDFLKGSPKPYAKLRVPDWTMELPQSEVTLGNIFKSQGYATAWLGKWHLGGDTLAYGFDVGNQDWLHNRKDDPADVKGAFTLNAEAKKFIDDNREKPFFVAISHYSPHGPIRFEPKLRDQYQKLIDDKQPRQTNPGYAAMIESLDTSVGEMLDWLDRRGLADNTLVIFTSDNGGLSSYTNNHPLRDQKGTLYEGGIRVPMITRWPGKIAAGGENDTRFCSSDLLPSLATIIGARQPDAIDGKDLSLVLTAGKSVDRGILYWHYPHYHNGKPSGAIVKGNWKLIEFFETGKPELYDLIEDPSEQHDLAGKKSEKAAELLADLKAWRTEVGAQVMEPNPDYDPAREMEGPPRKAKPVRKPQKQPEPTS